MTLGNFGQAYPSLWCYTIYMTTATNTQLDQLTDLVGTNLDDVLDGTSLAEAASYSRYYFQRRFRQLTGEGPSACRRRILLERAGYQLLNSPHPVTQHPVIRHVVIRHPLIRHPLIWHLVSLNWVTRHLAIPHPVTLHLINLNLVTRDLIGLHPVTRHFICTHQVIRHLIS